MDAFRAGEGQGVRAAQVLFSTRSRADTAEGAWKTVFVTSPADGVILHRDRLEEGALVRAGQSLAQVAPDAVPVRAVIELPEDTLLSLEPGQAVRLLLAAYPNQEFGTMEAILSSLNPVPVTSTSSPTPRARPPQAESR